MCPFDQIGLKKYKVYEIPDKRREEKLSAARRCAYRKQHVLFVLVDSSGIRHRVSVFDDGYRLPFKKRKQEMCTRLDLQGVHGMFQE